jgi:putative transposase
MKKTNFTESKIHSIIKRYEGGRAIDDLCRENGISKATVYNWRKMYNGMDGGQRLGNLKSFRMRTSA